MERVFITGGTGFIGSHLVKHLVKKGVSVRCLVRESSNLRWLEGMDVEYILGDVTDYNSFESAVSDVDTVFHLAARTKSLTKEGFYHTNVRGTVNLLKAVVQTNPFIKRLVYVSSQAACGPNPDFTPVTESDPPNPVTPYGASKLAGEKAVLNFSSQTPVTIVRPSVVYGPRDTEIYEFFRIVRRGIRPIVGWRDRYYSFIYIDDLIQGLLLAAESEKAVGQIYFLVTQSGVTYREFMRDIASAIGKKTVPVNVPMSLVIVIATVNELIAKLRGKPSVMNRHKVRELRERFWFCDGTKAMEELGFYPEVLMREGMEKCAAWYREIGWL